MPGPTCQVPFYPDPGVSYIAQSNDPYGMFYIVRKGRTEGIFTSFLRAEDETRDVANLDQIIPATNWNEAVDIWTVHCLKSHQKHGRVPWSRAHLTARIMLWGVKGIDYTFISSKDEFAEDNKEELEGEKE
ncbi:hypothetical protein B0H19DRAFT_1079875 [Mycena capillaripes]|nr:hypothetical protein B0H19DRAFT_1079875 [Mycena capillaripes]